jgi:DNA topoisomerase-1
MKLLIVESPGKIKKISEILGDEWIVVASVGHIIDLQPSNMSIDLKTFEPIYTRNHDKEKVVENIISKMNKVGKENVYLGSDEDREGEMIAWSLAKELKLTLTNCRRIVFNSITKKEIENAIAKYKNIDINMVYAQQARRLLDRLAGYTLSPLLSKYGIKDASSAGRVQSVVVKIIVDREKEINKFFSSNKDIFITVSNVSVLSWNNEHIKYNADLYYKSPESSVPILKVLLKEGEGGSGEGEGGCSGDGGCSGEGGSGDGDGGCSGDGCSGGSNKGSKRAVRFKKEETELVISTLKALSKCKYSLLSINSKIRKVYPEPPFTTSTMQQTLSRKYNMNSKKTMLVAQKLYEAGHITYMRTDSTNISQEASFSIKDYIIKKYGDNYYERRDYKNKKNNTQEAHECIRPTKINYEEIKGTPDEQKLYTEIWKRTVKSQMKPAEYQQYIIETEPCGRYIPVRSIEPEPCLKDGRYIFIGTIEELIYKGFKIVDEPEKKKDEPINLKAFIDCKECVKVSWDSIHATEYTEKPPTRYNDATLINKMDPKNLNIGRPSTYATIIDKILQRKYIEIKDIEGKQIELLKYRIDNKGEGKKFIDIDKVVTVIGNEKRKLVPTECGIKTTEFLEKNCKKLMDYNFTANMEKDLDLIAEGKKSKFAILNDFYNYLQQSLGNINDKGIKIDTNNKGIKIDTNDKGIKIDTNDKGIKIDTNNKGINIGSYKKKDIILNSGKYGHYITYGKNNYSLKEVSETNKKEEILEKALNIIRANKTWKINKKVYTLKKGKFGYYLEEGKNNISITKLINIIKKEDSNKNEIDIIEKITKDDISKFILTLVTKYN